MKDANGRELKKNDFVHIKGMALSGRVRKLEDNFAVIKYPKRKSLLYIPYSDVFYYDLNRTIKILTGQMA